MIEKRKSSQSVQDRLKNIAKREKKVPHLVYLNHVFGRFLYRLSLSKHGENLILKGGLRLYCEENTFRQTRDIDLLGRNIPNEKGPLLKIIAEICKIPGEDYVIFHGEDIEITDQMKFSKNPGFKLSIPFEFNSITDNMQIDVSFGEIIWPDARSIAFPSVLPEYNSFLILGYTLETLVAEKLHAIYSEGMRNTRMKDFFDLFQLLGTHRFIQKVLLNAIVATFQNRNTNIETLQLEAVLQNKFFDAPFLRFCKKSDIEQIPFAHVGNRLITAFVPIFFLVNDKQIPDDKVSWNPKKQQWD